MDIPFLFAQELICGVGHDLWTGLCKNVAGCPQNFYVPPSALSFNTTTAEQKRSRGTNYILVHSSHFHEKYYCSWKQKEDSLYLDIFLLEKARKERKMKGKKKKKKSSIFKLLLFSLII